MIHDACWFQVCLGLIALIYTGLVLSCNGQQKFMFRLTLLSIQVWFYLVMVSKSLHFSTENFLSL